MNDLLFFFLILLLFVVSFGVIYHAIIFPNSPADLYVVRNVFHYAYFMMYGELFLDTMRGMVFVKFVSCCNRQSVYDNNSSSGNNDNNNNNNDNNNSSSDNNDDDDDIIMMMMMMMIMKGAI